MNYLQLCLFVYFFCLFFYVSCNKVENQEFHSLESSGAFLFCKSKVSRHSTEKLPLKFLKGFLVAISVLFFLYQKKNLGRYIFLVYTSPGPFK